MCGVTFTKHCRQTTNNKTMKPEDVIQQLCGKSTAWDQADTLCFVLYEAEKFSGKDVNVNFEEGVLEVIEEDGSINQKFAIQATLVPITE